MNKVGDLLAEFDLGFGTPYQVIVILIPIIVGYIIGYILYIGYIYIYCYIIVVASQGSDGSILEKPEQDDCGKLCRTSVSAEPVRIKLEKRIYNISQTQTATGGHVQMSAGNKWASCWFRLGSTRIA